MKIKEQHKRLERFWGKVDEKHINIICDHLKGSRILDMGCGYGTTTNFITNNLNLDCIGIDYDKQVVDMCRERYPNCNFIVANAEKLPFDDNYFDTIILRDALHHFYQEADFSKVKGELIRVAKKSSRIIFFDPNINLLLKTMRILASHEDAECNYESALSIQEEMGYEIVHKNFNTLFSLPLSGGYVGINFIPNYIPLQNFILNVENMFEKIVNSIGIGRNLCWRYLVVGERIND